MHSNGNLQKGWEGCDNADDDDIEAKGHGASCHEDAEDNRLVVLFEGLQQGERGGIVLINSQGDVFLFLLYHLDAGFGVVLHSVSCW